jgi:hypothetical protein
MRAKESASQSEGTARDRTEKQLAEAAKRQRLNNAKRAILPKSEKGKASEQAAKMISATLTT